MLEVKGVIIKLGLRSVTIKLKDEKNYKDFYIGSCILQQQEKETPPLETPKEKEEDEVEPRIKEEIPA